MRGRFCPGDSFDSNRTVIEVDVAAGLILIGVFHVVLRTGDHHLFESPDVLNIVGKLPHQNIKTVGIFDPGFVIGIAFFGRRTGDEQRRNQSQREIFFIIPGACCVCFYASCRRRAPALFLFFIFRRIALDMHLFTLEQEVDHLLLQQLAVLGIHHVEFLFINQHGLFVLPLRPGFFGDLVIDAFSQLAGYS